MLLTKGGIRSEDVFSAISLHNLCVYIISISAFVKVGYHTFQQLYFQHAI